MKKIILFLFLLTSFCHYSQTKIKAYVEKNEVVSFDQYDVIKKVNDYYPDIQVSKQIVNTYKNDLKTNDLIESYFVYEIPSNCITYSVLLYPDNSALDYQYQKKDGSYFYGNIRLFNGSVYRTLFAAYSDKRISSYYIDGKLINEVKY